MSNEALDPNEPTFATIAAIKADMEDIENERAAWTPEWMLNAIMSAWQHGQLAGNTDGYFGSSRARNPFMTEAETKAWYGR